MEQWIARNRGTKPGRVLCRAFAGFDWSARGEGMSCLRMEEKQYAFNDVHIDLANAVRANNKQHNVAVPCD